jgi:hypothetical protein
LRELDGHEEEELKNPQPEIEALEEIDDEDGENGSGDFHDVAETPPIEISEKIKRKALMRNHESNLTAEGAYDRGRQRD